MESKWKLPSIVQYDNELKENQAQDRWHIHAFYDMETKRARKAESDLTAALDLLEEYTQGELRIDEVQDFLKQFTP